MTLGVTLIVGFFVLHLLGLTIQNYIDGTETLVPAHFVDDLLFTQKVAEAPWYGKPFAVLSSGNDFITLLIRYSTFGYSYLPFTNPVTALIRVIVTVMAFGMLAAGGASLATAILRR